MREFDFEKIGSSFRSNTCPNWCGFVLIGSILSEFFVSNYFLELCPSSAPEITSCQFRAFDVYLFNPKQVENNQIKANKKENNSNEK